MKRKREALVNTYITEALLQLLKQKDYKDISITEICSRAGVTRMSFYRNFESKDDILRKYVREITNTFLIESQISYKNDSTRDYFVKLFSHMKQQEDFCNALYKAGLIFIIKDEYDHVFQKIHINDYDPYKSYFLSGGIYNVFLLWLLNGCKEAPEQMADKMSSFLIK